MNLDERAAAPHGHFLLRVYRKGLIVPELCVDEPNLIVDGSKSIHARLLGGDVTNRSVTQIGYGTSGTAPAGGNTSLSGPPFFKAVDATTYPTTSSVKFEFSLAAGENNGMAILEFGLITAGGALYARKVRSVALNKDSEISFAGSWTITF